MGTDGLPPIAGCVTVMVVTDVRLYRDGLVASLRSRSNLQVLSNVDGVPVLDQILEVGPDVVLIDTATQHSLEIVRTLRERAPATKAVVFAIHEYGGEVVKYAEAGAAGYVACDASFDQLVSAIEAVAREELVCPPRIASTLFRRLGAYGRSGGITSIVCSRSSRPRIVRSWRGATRSPRHPAGVSPPLPIHCGQAAESYRGPVRD